MKKQIKTIEIEVRRWFQKSYGNTFHSVMVCVNNKILENGFQYGYSDQFFQTAWELRADMDPLTAAEMVMFFMHGPVSGWLMTVKRICDIVCLVMLPLIV